MSTAGSILLSVCEELLTHAETGKLAELESSNYFGVCGLVFDAVCQPGWRTRTCRHAGHPYRLLKDLMIQYPAGTGKSDYVLKDPQGNLSPEEWYHRHRNKWTGVALKQRVHLLQYIIEELKRGLA